jgi:hypothetical protein
MTAEELRTSAFEGSEECKMYNHPWTEIYGQNCCGVRPAHGRWRLSVAHRCPKIPMAFLRPDDLFDRNRLRPHIKPDRIGHPAINCLQTLSDLWEMPSASSLGSRKTVLDGCDAGLFTGQEYKCCRRNVICYNSLVLHGLGSERRNMTSQSSRFIGCAVHVQDRRRAVRRQERQSKLCSIMFMICLSSPLPMQVYRMLCKST